MKTYRWFTAVAPLMALVCAAAPAPAAVQSRTTLTNQDNGRPVTVHKGDEISVRLTAKRTAQEQWAWSAPTAADTTVIGRTSARTAPNGDAAAVFHAEADGTTALTAQARCTPRVKGHLCPHTVTSWRVTVQVR
ncbi:hypothetical protein [Streptomyces huiliensis]|uniref:hypothetical protein n=1 Tax=Streptomyces huiliensis TaxID=2876027 RepID=UPI001CBAE273|nr:hypothetical protein [Streptomyces huiliensis]MBZ4319572.1 hypothetical protein [Streptomyces huiliensis]